MNPSLMWRHWREGVNGTMMLSQLFLSSPSPNAFGHLRNSGRIYNGWRRNYCSRTKARAALAASELPITTIVHPSISNRNEWHLFAGVLIERCPVIARPMNSYERNYRDMQMAVEIERSHKSDHELMEELEAQELEEARVNNVRLPIRIRLEDLDEQYKRDVASIHQYATTSEPWHSSGAANNPKSTDLQSRLDQKLMMIVKERLGRNDNVPTQWTIPRLLVDTNETLRQAVERRLRNLFGPKWSDYLEIQGNAPFCFYKYKYPNRLQQSIGGDQNGAKVFVLKALMKESVWKRGLPLLNGAVADAKWIVASGDELGKYNKPLSKKLAPILFS